jgi:hypothetical protein
MTDSNSKTLNIHLGPNYDDMAKEQFLQEQQAIFPGSAQAWPSADQYLTKKHQSDLQVDDMIDHVSMQAVQKLMVLGTHKQQSAIDVDNEEVDT